MDIKHLVHYTGETANPSTPERRLAAAVLHRAFMDLCYINVSSREHVANAVEWFRGCDARFTFRDIADLLDLTQEQREWFYNVADQANYYLDFSTKDSHPTLREREVFAMENGHYFSIYRGRRAET